VALEGTIERQLEPKLTMPKSFELFHKSGVPGKQPMLSTHRLMTFVPYWEHLCLCGISLIPDMHQMNCLPS